MMMRLQKFLAHAGVCSRRKGEEYIMQGLVSVNGETILSCGTKVNPEKDTVSFDGSIISIPFGKKNIYIALNKPAGYVASCSHPGEKIILDLVDVPQRIYPVGRLDKDSIGLILLTDDGELHNRLSHPSFNHEKEYVVHTVHPVTNSAISKMSDGIMLDGKKIRKARIKRLSKFSFNIVLKQGVNRQIRRMVPKTGNSVKTLKRIRMGAVKLGSLKQGAWRHLTSKEILDLKQP